MAKKQKEDNYLDNPWYYKGIVVDSVPEGAVGFVYEIERHWDEFGEFFHKSYTGKKQVTTERRKRIGIREKQETKTRKTYKKIIKESDWKNYWGSCKTLLEDIKNDGSRGGISYSRTIKEWCYTKRYLTYCEVKWQIKNDVLATTTYNDNILSKFFRACITENEEVKNGYTGTD